MLLLFSDQLYQRQRSSPVLQPLNLLLAAVYPQLPDSSRPPDCPADALRDGEGSAKACASSSVWQDGWVGLAPTGNGSSVKEEPGALGCGEQLESLVAAAAVCIEVAEAGDKGTACIKAAFVGGAEVVGGDGAKQVCWVKLRPVLVGQWMLPLKVLRAESKVRNLEFRAELRMQGQSPSG